MLSELRSSFGFNMKYLKLLAADLDDSQLVVQRDGVPNHATWTIGHLIYTCERMCEALGQTGWLPEDWSEHFGTGSTPVGDPAEYPSKTELLAALDLADRNMLKALDGENEDSLTRPLPNKQYRKVFPTVGHALLYILLSHFSMHVGQLTVWRRACGFEVVKEPFA